MSEERRDTVFGTTVDNGLVAEGGTKVDLTGRTEDNKHIFEKTLNIVRNCWKERPRPCLARRAITTVTCCCARAARAY